MSLMYFLEKVLTQVEVMISFSNKFVAALQNVFWTDVSDHKLQTILSIASIHFILLLLHRSHEAKY